MLEHMGKSWRLGNVFGFPVEINVSFLLLLAFVFLAYGGLGGLLITTIAFGCVLLHELGHAVVARQRNVHVASIELSFFGGAAKMVNMPRTANDEIAIAAAGPAVSLMLGGASFGLGVALGAPLLLTIGWINIVIAAFNLIPALPMDGGRILRAALAKRMDFVRATDISVRIAHGAAIAFGVFGLVFGWYQLMILAPFLWLMSNQERANARILGDRYDFRSRGPFDGGPPRGGFYREVDRDDGYARGGYGSGFSGRRASDFGDGFAGASALPRRFTIRRVNGRLVIEAIE